MGEWWNKGERVNGERWREHERCRGETKRRARDEEKWTGRAREKERLRKRCVEKDMKRDMKDLWEKSKGNMFIIGHYIWLLKTWRNDDDDEKDLFITCLLSQYRLNKKTKETNLNELALFQTLWWMPHSDVIVVWFPIGIITFSGFP